MTKDEIHKLCEKVATALSEHADSVQIMVTWNEEAETHRYFIGAGNWYARQGMAQEFINQDVSRTNAREISDVLNPPSDDAESWKKP